MDTESESRRASLVNASRKSRGAKNSDSTEVFVSGRVHAMSHLSEIEGTIKMVIRTFLFWNDPSGKIKKALNPGNKYDSSKLYSKDEGEWPESIIKDMPKLDIYGKPEDTDRQCPEIRLFDSDDSSPYNIMLTELRTIEILVDNDLHSFPIDMIDVPIKCWFPKLKDTSRFNLQPNFKAVSPERIPANIPIDFGPRGTAGISSFEVMGVEHKPEQDRDGFSVTFVVPLKRLHMYWIYRYIFPETIITTLAFTSFLSSMEVYSNRAGVNLTLLLMLFAMNISAVSELPKVHYLTLMDHYHYTCIYTISLIVVGNAVVLIPALKDISDTLDKICYAAIGAIWFLIQVYALLRVKFLGRKAAKTKTKLIKNSSKRLELLSHVAPGSQV